MSIIRKIRQKILNRDYYLSSHAEDEMLNDDLERHDVERVVLTGKINRKLVGDIRGTRYRIEGSTKYGRKVRVICRYREDGSLIIITVYIVEEKI